MASGFEKYLDIFWLISLYLLMIFWYILVCADIFDLLLIFGYHLISRDILVSSGLL